MCILLTLGNSYSRITGLDQDQMKRLRKLLSYKISYTQAKYIRDPNKHIKYCMDVRGNFATGLLPKVTAHLREKKLIYYVNSTGLGHMKPYKVIPGEFKPSVVPTPYPDQESALNTVLGTCRGVISMPTGTGKSLVMARVINAFKVRTLVVVPTLELKNQLQETFSQYFQSLEGISIENIDNPKLKTMTDYDCLIIDECHRAAAETYRKLNKIAWHGIRKRYSFTATPFRNDKEEQLLYEGVAGQVIYELSYLTAVQSGYIVPVECYYYDLPQVEVKGNVYAKVYDELVVKNDFRNQLIAGLLKNLWTNRKHCLCLVKEIEHGKILSELTGIPFANGADEDSRQWIQTFKEGRLKVLIGTEGILGEGVDTKPAEYVLICGAGKARSAFMQKVGRAVRKYPGKESAKIIIFRDKSHRWMLQHFREQCKIIRDEYNTTPIELESK